MPHNEDHQPPSTTDGPDPHHTSILCKEHHDGRRVGPPTDFCCCCDPCRYRKIDGTGGAFKRHCCRCNPIVITIRFDPSNYDECCGDPIANFAFGEQVSLSSLEPAVRFSTSIYGKTINVYLSSFPVSGEYSVLADGVCRWTIEIPEDGVFEEVIIDHNNVTCLGVPDIEITGIEGPELCFGTISLRNVEGVKVPFQKILFDEYFYDGHDLWIPRTICCNEGQEYECCTVPRWLCVAGNRSLGGANERVNFLWTEGFTEYEFADGWVIGQWTYTDPVTEVVDAVYLIRNEYGFCEFRTDFEGPEGFRVGSDSKGELYPNLPLDSDDCFCNTRVLGRYPETGDPDMVLKIRPGACSCYEWFCDQCRCLPRYLCVAVFYANAYYPSVLLEWNGSGWASSGESTSADGYSTIDDLTLNLVSVNEGASCGVELSFNNFDLDPVLIECDVMLAFAIEGQEGDYQDGEYISLLAVTALDPSDCPPFACGVTPCNASCGSDPDSILVTWEAFAYEEELLGYCAGEMTLYKQYEAAVTGPADLELTCSYVGYLTLDCYGGVQVLRMTLSSGTLMLEDSSGDGNFQTIWEYDLDEETCPPYYASVFRDNLGFDGCWFECDQPTIDEITIELFEQ